MTVIVKTIPYRVIISEMSPPITENELLPKRMPATHRKTTTIQMMETEEGKLTKFASVETNSVHINNSQ